MSALLDPASPFLELSPLAAHDVYPDALPGAGIVTGIGKLPYRLCNGKLLTLLRNGSREEMYDHSQ